MTKARLEALEIIRSMTDEQRSAIALVIDTAEVQGDYCFDGENSVWEDDVAYTLSELADEIRKTR